MSINAAAATAIALPLIVASTRSFADSTRNFAEKTARVGREAGVAGLVALALRKLASPVVAWGGIAFFERRLGEWTPPAATTSSRFQAVQLSAADVDALRA